MELHISETRMQTSVEVEVRVRISIFLQYSAISHCIMMHNTQCTT